MSNGKFEIYTGNDNQYWFRLKAPNGEIIGKSEGYVAKQSAENGINSVRKNSQNDDNFRIWQSDKNNQWYFHLKSSDNGQIILNGSEGYVSKQGAETGIASVKTNAPDALVIDLT